MKWSLNFWMSHTWDYSHNFFLLHPLFVPLLHFSNIHWMLFMESSRVRATGLLSLASSLAMGENGIHFFFHFGRNEHSPFYSPLCVCASPSHFTGRKKAVAGGSKWILIALAMFMWTELQIWISFSSWFDIMRAFCDAGSNFVGGYAIHLKWQM